MSEHTHTAPGKAARPGRIALMLPRFSRYGGAEQFGYRLAGALAARGHEVDFICGRQDAEPPAGVRVISVGRPPGFKAVKLLWYLLRAEQARKKGNYDLCISLGKNLNQDLIRMGGGPLEVFWEKTARAAPPGLRRSLKHMRRRLSPASGIVKWVEKRQFTAHSEVLAVSHLVREWLLAAHPELDPARVGVIYNRPDLDRFYPPSQEERALARRALAELCGFAPEMEASAAAPDTHALSRPENAAPVLIGTASTNFELKGVAPLIRALALLPEHARLLVAGGRDASAYLRLAASLGLEKRVHFCGRLDDMPAFYRGLDIFILPTFYDACSNAVLEALASGLKVISGKDNGSAYFLEKDALLDDPGDHQAMAAKLLESMAKPRPAPFVWPEKLPSGMEAFVAEVERKLEEKHPAAQE